MACENHTPCPTAYIEWHEWAEKKGKTHKQALCPDCKSLAVWVPKSKMDTEKVTRFEVIDHTRGGKGRVLVEYGVNVEVQIQDEGRTLKVFLSDNNRTTK